MIKRYKYITILFILSIILYLLDYYILSFFVFIPIIFLLIIYKDFNREIYGIDSEILSPIDGEISAIDIKKDKKIVYIEVGLFDNHIIRAPIDGDFQTKHIKGLNLNSDLYKGTLLNEKILVNFENLKITFLAGIFNISMKIYNNNEKIFRGDRIGIFTNGKVKLELNNNKILVNIGDKVKAGETIIAT